MALDILDIHVRSRQRENVSLLSVNVLVARLPSAVRSFSLEQNCPI